MRRRLARRRRLTGSKMEVLLRCRGTGKGTDRSLEREIGHGLPREGGGGGGAGGLSRGQRPERRRRPLGKY